VRASPTSCVEHPLTPARVEKAKRVATVERYERVRARIVVSGPRIVSFAHSRSFYSSGHALAPLDRKPFGCTFAAPSRGGSQSR
jgi:hypothetical protein